MWRETFLGPAVIWGYRKHRPCVRQSSVFQSESANLAEGAGFPEEIVQRNCSQHMQNPCEQAPGTPSSGGDGGWGWSCPPAAEDEDMEREGSKPQERAFVRSMEQSKPLQKNPTNQTKKTLKSPAL